MNAPFAVIFVISDSDLRRQNAWVIGRDTQAIPAAVVTARLSNDERSSV